MPVTLIKVNRIILIASVVLTQIDFYRFAE